MVAIGTRDGREIVQAFDALRASKGLGRTPDGRWILGAPESKPPGGVRHHA